MTSQRRSFEQQATARRAKSNAGIIPLDTSSIVLLAIFLSLFFIAALSAAFAGADQDTPYFNHFLLDLDPGVRLF
jgi:hypothetical protein